MNPSPSRNHRFASSRRRLVGVLLALGVCAAGVFIAQRGRFPLFPAVAFAPAKVDLPIQPAARSITAASIAGTTAGAPETPTVTSDPPDKSRPTAESIQALAATDHLRALAIALAESDPQFRDELLQAAVRGWAGTDADAAAAWARSQSYLDSGQAFAAVFNGANQNPDKAVTLARRLSEEDPENAGSYASYLIFALNRVEKFELAASVAASGGAESRTDLLTAAYGAWAERHPHQALSAAAELKDPEMRRTAFEATLGGWAKSNPRELTEVAMNLAEGPDRKLALTTALRSWIDKDPAAVAEWAAHAKFFAEMEATLEE